MTGEVVIQLPGYCLNCHDRKNHNPATQIMSLYCHMTEGIIQLPGYCLYTVIWQEKSSSSYPNNVYTVIWQEKSSSSFPDTVSILSYDNRSHHLATRIMFLYWHMTEEIIIQLPGYCLYTVIWQEKSSSIYPDNISTLTYDRRSHNPATQIMSIQSYDRKSRNPATWMLSVYCHMTV